MKRKYDLFERLPDGSPLWRGCATDLGELEMKLREIAERTSNECFAMQLATGEVVGRANVDGQPHSVILPILRKAEGNSSEA